MLDVKAEVPHLAQPILDDLKPQAAASPQREAGRVTSWDAAFTSPAADWIPESSRQAHIRVLLPPAGAHQGSAFDRVIEHGR